MLPVLCKPRRAHVVGAHDFLNWCTARDRWLPYSVGMTITDAVHHAVLLVPASARTPAVEPGGQVRDSAWVAELAGDVLKGWPAGMRLIVRKERPVRREALLIRTEVGDLRRRSCRSRTVELRAV